MIHSINDLNLIGSAGYAPSANTISNFDPSAIANSITGIMSPGVGSSFVAPGGELADEAEAIYSDAVSTNNPGIVQTDGTSVDNAESGGFSLSEFMNSNPGATPEQIMEEAAKHGDEFAEKWIDYLLEQGALDKANAYTASREDTAYQRLVSDLKAAGLNPAMMYGSSASPSAAGSQGYVKMVEGANSRSISNYSKIKQVILNLLKYELQKGLGIANTVIDGIGTVGDIATGILKIFM